MGVGRTQLSSNSSNSSNICQLNKDVDRISKMMEKKREKNKLYCTKLVDGLFPSHTSSLLYVSRKKKSSSFLQLLKMNSPWEGNGKNYRETH